MSSYSSMWRPTVARERLRSPSPAAAETLHRQGSSGSTIVGGGRLEASLLQLIHDHQLASFRLREQTEKAKKEAAEAAARVSEVVVDAVNGGVQDSFINEKRIELEIRAVAAAVYRYKRETDHWIAASRTINTAIKELGDLENWMKIMEYDCRGIGIAILNIHHS